MIHNEEPYVAQNGYSSEIKECKTARARASTGGDDVICIGFSWKSC
jgi:hypothetical protein